MKKNSLIFILLVLVATCRADDKPTETIGVLWFAGGELTHLTKVKLVIDGLVHDPERDFEQQPMAAAEAQALDSGFGFYRVYFKITNEKKRRLKARIWYHDFSGDVHYCTPFYCLVLEEAGIIKTPVVFSAFASWALAYQAGVTWFRQKPIEKIDYVGKHRLRDLLSNQIAAEAALTLTAAFPSATLAYLCWQILAR